MKIVYFNYLYDVKESSVGAGVHVEELSRHLAACGHRILTFYLNRSSGTGPGVESRMRDLLKQKLGRYLKQFSSLVANGRYFLREWKIIAQERPDVILARYNVMNFSLALAARIRRIPFVLEINAPMAYETRLYAAGAFYLPCLPEWLEKLNLKLADAVFVVSRALRDYYTEWGVALSQCRVIPNGVDEKIIHPGLTGEVVLEKWGLGGKTVLGFLGSFHYWHGMDDLARFIREVLDRFPGSVFLLVGEGPLKEDLVHRMKNEGLDDRVVFPGYVDHGDIPGYIAAMDILLAPYPDLTFFYYSPLKLFEYMAAGKPVIATRIGQIADVIEDGKNGLLCEPGDIDDMIRQAERLMTDPQLRRSLGKAARQTIEEGFTWRHVAEQVSDLLREAAGADNNGDL